MTYEPLIRLTVFVGIFVSLAFWEVRKPRRQLQLNKVYRWLNNLSIVAIYSFLLRLIFPAAAVGFAVFAENHGLGLFYWLDLSGWVVLVLGVILLDFAIWVQHVMFHRIPVLWRLHRMHHADQDVDLTTGLRFHPIEILLSMLIKAGIILLLGVPAIAVLIFEILLNTTSMFNHSNVKMPLGLDRWLRLIVVTPDMHRVHHSWYLKETNSNYGFNFPWWDRLLTTYRAQPKDGHETMTIGLNLFRDHKDQRIDRMLVQPFIGPTHSHQIRKNAANGFGDK